MKWAIILLVGIIFMGCDNVKTRDEFLGLLQRQNVRVTELFQIRKPDLPPVPRGVDITKLTNMQRVVIEILKDENAFDWRDANMLYRFTFAVPFKGSGGEGDADMLFVFTKDGLVTHYYWSKSDYQLEIEKGGHPATP